MRWLLQEGLPGPGLDALRQQLQRGQVGQQQGQGQQEQGIKALQQGQNGLVQGVGRDDEHADMAGGLAAHVPAAPAPVPTAAELPDL